MPSHLLLWSFQAGVRWAGAKTNAQHLPWKTIFCRTHYSQEADLLTQFRSFGLGNMSGEAHVMGGCLHLYDDGVCVCVGLGPRQEFNGGPNHHHPSPLR